MHRRGSAAGLLLAAAFAFVLAGVGPSHVQAEEPEPTTTTIAPPPTTEPPAPTTAPTAPPTSPPATTAPPPIDAPPLDEPPPTEAPRPRPSSEVTPSTLVLPATEETSTTTSSTTSTTSSTRAATPTTTAQELMTDEPQPASGRSNGLLLPAGVASVTAMVTAMGVAIWRVRRSRRRSVPAPTDDGFLTPPRPSTEPMVPIEPLVFFAPIVDRPASSPEPEPEPGSTTVSAGAAAMTTVVDARDEHRTHDAHDEHHGNGKRDDPAHANGSVDLGDLSGMWPEPEPSVPRELTDSEELSRLLFPDHPATNRAGRA